MLLRQRRAAATAPTVAAATLLLVMLRPLALDALTVDNQLVSARNDCFERIALEAMLPFEKSFSTEDTNSLKTCKERCIQAGEKCQTISFGVHRRGNGTCQLSSEKYGASAGRPSGVIFDPDFDLYARKTNCFDLTDDNTIPLSDSGPTGGGGSGGGGGGDGGGGYGGNISPTPSVLLSSRPTDGTTPLLVFNPMPSTSTTIFNDRPPPPSPPTAVYDTTLPQHALSSVGPSHGPSTTADGDRLYFSHDVYPLYKFPMLYEHNYPAPNDDIYIPGGYASNVPEVEDRYRPIYASDDNVRPTASGGPPRPIFGLGYGNGYSYGKPERYDPSTLHPAYGQVPQNDRDRPNYTPRPGPYPSERPDRPLGPHGRPPTRPTDYDYTTPSTTYGPRPGYDPHRMPSHDQRPPPPPPPTSPGYGAAQGQRPGDFIDYTNRPDAPPHAGYGGAGTSSRPPMRDPGPGSGPGPGPGLDYGDGGGVHSDSNRYDFVRRNGTAARPGGYNDDKMIATYFNPEDYRPGSTNKHRPGSYPDRDRYPLDQMKACFRRVLAGKRIAPHWVRRTIACERVEECMRECGHEKRFMCEGFNYRLDPSGHGQGDCELIEVPLAQMDLYSSANQRDSNLLRHPDYDYYERDRNAPSSCRRDACKDCSKGGILASAPLYFKPSGWSEKPPYREEHYLPSPPSGGSSSSGSSGYGGDSHRYRPPLPPPPPSSSSTAVDRYRPPPSAYDHRPPSGGDYHSSSYDYSSHGSSYFEHTPPSSYGSSGSSGSTGSGPIDRYDGIRPGADDHRYRPSALDRWIPTSSGYDDSKYLPRPEPDRKDRYRPAYHPGPDYSPYRPSSGHDLGPSRPSGPAYHPIPPRGPPSHNYLDRDEPLPPPRPPPSSYKKPSKFVPYSIGGGNDWGSYGGNYGGSYNKQSSYWGLSDRHGPRDRNNFNYFDLGGTRRSGGPPPPRESYPGSRYSGYNDYDESEHGFRDRHDYRHQWTRRPGPDECSAKTSEGFRLHKTAVKHSYNVPTLTECERLCSGQDGFVCHTYSYRYTQAGRDNCMLCDRPVNLLDYYVDIEPDRDYDIYSMADEMDICRKPSRSDGPADGPGSTTALSDPRNAQCFFRAIDATRFFKSIVRDSLTVRSVGECEMECIRSMKFTCRAFAFRYGQQRHANVIDNCQLSDWPVRDMDKERHLILDATFDVFERASYGHGCEIQPIVDEKHKKSVCYLGYGSPAKLLAAAVKKVISVASELDCKKECIRFRETTSFKCYSFSFGSRAKSYNCEMSDLDQTELKLNVHYTHSSDRDYWLFAWNPFDWTCRDKVNTIGGSRVNNDRRMDIFREPGDVAWRHYTVSGKPCRRSSPCEKNLVTGFYSCEINGAEIGAWDYCCKADHTCGYSQGFDYPWCFVGDEPDQWRKCSDRYYPGNGTHAGITLAPTHSDKKQKHPTSGKKGGSSSDEYQHPPRPGGLQSLSDFAAARLWPVTYLWSEGPPNSTEFSNFVDCNKESC